MQTKEDLFNAPSQGEKFLDEVKRIINKNLSDSFPALGVAALCKKLCIGRSTLFRKFREITGKSPNDYIIDFRLERAAQLLKEDKGNVTDVAGEVGFDNPQYFAKCFREKFGQAPKAFQLSYIKTAPGKEDAVSPGSVVSPKTQIKIKIEFTLEELDRELVCRLPLPKLEKLLNSRVETPQLKEIFVSTKNYYDSIPAMAQDDALKNITPQGVIEKIRKTIDELKEDSFRKGRTAINTQDIFEIEEKRIRNNAQATAAVCMNADLIPCGAGYSQIRVENFGKTFNLCSKEQFFDQPTAAGPMCTGALVAEDVMATVAHFVNERNISDIRFVFDFVMQNSNTPTPRIPDKNIYKGVGILQRVHNPESDWVLVKLDRKVSDRGIAALSQKKIFYEQPVYIIGHPCGLPLKLAPGAYVTEITGSDFRTYLDIYGSNNGSPVFCAETHELIGIVSRSKPANLRWTGNCWISLSYPGNTLNFPGSRCTRATEFIQYI